jgi:hypothetical protein
LPPAVLTSVNNLHHGSFTAKYYCIIRDSARFFKLVADKKKVVLNINSPHIIMHKYIAFYNFICSSNALTLMSVKGECVSALKSM